MDDILFSGACTALVTPFLEGKVNYPLYRTLLMRQINAGVPAVVVAGTTGEAATLSDKEKLELFRISKEVSDGRCKIIAGTGSNSTAHAISLSVQAEKEGADALLIVSPYYNKANSDGLFSHYLAIAHSVSIPIILYNVPSRTGVDIPVSVYKRLSRVPNIIGVKEASTDITKIGKIINVCGPDFAVWTGNDDHTVPAMALGAKGVVSVVSNVCPEQMVKLTDAALQGDYATASAMGRALLPFVELMFCEVSPIPVKAAMGALGYDCGGCRLPLTSLSAVNEQRIREYFT